MQEMRPPVPGNPLLQGVRGREEKMPEVREPQRRADPRNVFRQDFEESVAPRSPDPGMFSHTEGSTGHPACTMREAARSVNPMYGPLLISLLPPEPIGEAARTATDPVPCISILLLAGLLLSLLTHPPRR